MYGFGQEVLNKLKRKEKIEGSFGMWHMFERKRSERFSFSFIAGSLYLVDEC